MQEYISSISTFLANNAKNQDLPAKNLPNICIGISQHAQLYVAVDL